MELLIGATLRIGVIAAAAVAAVGGSFLLLSGASSKPDFARFLGEPAYLTNIAGIFRSAFSGNARGIIQLGLIVLISVPILRVAVSLVAFAFRKDWLYSAVTAAVLALLVVSLATGR
jgi:uncharacterized membrane protein